MKKITFREYLAIFRVAWFHADIICAYKGSLSPRGVVDVIVEAIRENDVETSLERRLNNKIRAV